MKDVDRDYHVCRFRTINRTRLQKQYPRQSLFENLKIFAEHYEVVKIGTSEILLEIDLNMLRPFC